jgi:hypothetical protein
MQSIRASHTLQEFHHPTGDYSVTIPAPHIHLLVYLPLYSKYIYSPHCTLYTVSLLRLHFNGQQTSSPVAFLEITPFIN